MKSKHWYFRITSVLGSGLLFFVLMIGCVKEEAAIETVPNPNPGPAKLISEVEITQDAMNETITIREVGVADPETGELLSTEATELTSGIAYNVGSCTAASVGGQWRTCCNVNITNNTGGSIASVVLHGDSAVSGNPSAARSGGSGTGYDGSGTGWGNNSASNGGYALWMVKASTGNVIANGSSSDNRTLCLQSQSGYSASRWRLYKDAILGKIVDRDTNTAITTGGWAMLGMASPDNTSFPELGTGNFVDTDAQGNFGFPYLGPATNFTITVGATNYARQTIFETKNKNITFYLKSRTLRGRVAVGNYNGTLANASNPTPAPTIGGNCTATGNLACEGYVRVGLLVPAMGYEDVYSLSLEALIGPKERLVVSAATGTCDVGLTTMTLDLLPSNIIIPDQNEGPLAVLGYNNAYLRLNKLEWWVPAPPSTSNVTVASIWGLVPRSAFETLANVAMAGGPANIASLVTGINPQCTGWRRNITTGTTNLQGQAFTINRSNNLSPLRLTLNNLPTTATTTYSRTALGLMGVEFVNNPAPYQRLTAISIGGNTVNTVGSTNILLPSSNQTLDTDAYLLPLALVADLDKNANTWDQGAVVAIADRGRYKTYSNTTFSSFFGLPTLTWSTINTNNRRVAYANPEKTTSPWIDVGVGIISKSSYINTITEESSSCAQGAGCCDNQTSGICSFDQKGSENLWEFLVRGRTSTSAPVTDWTIPDLPAAVDLPVGNPTNYPDRNYPSLAVVAAGWCPGSPLCTANSTSNEFGFDTNGSINDVLNNTTHFALNTLHIGGIRIINPPNQYVATAAGNVTVNGFLDAGNWDVVSCDRVYVETWQTASDVEECGTCPAGTGCGSTVVNPNCPANHCCSNTTAMTPLTPAGGCGASLPRYCFTIPVYISNDRWRHVKISPRLGGSYANTCGEGSGEWYFKLGNP